MTAKPQPMAGQSDTSDDLIAELAKLMAQDAKSDKPAAPTANFPVRIPGESPAPAQAPVPRFDFRAPAPSSPVVAPPSPVVSEPAARQAPPVAAAPVPTPPPAAVPTPAPATTTADAFNFDFGLSSPRVAAPTSPMPPAADAGFVPVDHDSIADLIAAELEDSAPPVAAPEPAPARVAVAPSPQPRPAPQPSSRWSPVAVPANLAGQNKPQSAPMRPLNLQPAARPEQDRFKVAPVFGLSSGGTDTSVSPVVSEASVAPAPSRSEPTFGWAAPQPAPKPAPVADEVDDGIGRDPIDEIESLIGHALRVDLDRGNGRDRGSDLDTSNEPVRQPEMPAPSPALRSLATPLALEPSGRKLSGADEAILAAAEATGVHIGWVDSPDVADAAAAAPRRQARRGRGLTRAVAGPLVAVTLLLAAGFGLYWVLGLGSEPGPAPLLTADATPVKQTPEVTADSATPQQSVVFNEIDGVVPGAEEQLVSRDQTDVNEVTQVPAASDLSEEGLANRKVRTVTVRPDGTIVSGEDSVAGSTILPVARPNVPAVPGADTTTPELVANTAPAAETTPVETPAATPAPAAVVPVTPGATVPAVDLAGNPLPGKTTVVPLIRPQGLVGPSAAETTTPTSGVNAVVNSGVASGNMLPPPPSNNTLGLSAPASQTATPVALQTPATTAPQATEVTALGNNAPAYVQLASQRTEDEARASANAMVTRYGPLFGGASLEVQRVDLGERGIYYRVRVPAGSMTDANNICTNVKAAGGDCFTM